MRATGEFAQYFMACSPQHLFAILEHVWITFQVCLDHISRTFQARLDHISSRFQEQTCCVTQFQNSCVPITFKAILEHVWIIFQACFKNEHPVLPSFKNCNYWACLDHISSTFQEQTCCVTNFQNSWLPITFKAILEHVWISFQAHFKNENAVLPSFKIHVGWSHFKQFWSMFGSHFKHIWTWISY
jgi:hypothetical protein